VAGGPAERLGNLRKKAICLLGGVSLAALVLPAKLLSSSSRISSRQASQEITGSAGIKVNVSLVDLAVSVTDHSGHFVRGLTKNDFQVFEDGKPEEISLFDSEDVPASVGIIVDHSGSMAPNLPEVSAAAAAFVKSSNPQDEIFVENFNEGIRMGLPPGTEFSSNMSELAKAVMNQSARGKTALYDALAEALEYLQKGHRQREALVLISDGGDNASSHTFSQVLAKAENSNVAIYTVGIFDPLDEDRNPGALKKLSKNTGGQAYFPKSAGEVSSICREIAREIREQYIIGYLPANRDYNSAYRKLVVVAKAPGRGRLNVRTRTGYLAVPGATNSTSAPKANP
jgi:Ca-activated chloride channel homolog